jgi:hypothetical protein
MRVRRSPKANERMVELELEVEELDPLEVEEEAGGVRSQLPPEVKTQPVVATQAPQAPVEVM